MHVQTTGERIYMKRRRIKRKRKDFGPVNPFSQIQTIQGLKM